jgi:hypothetical protein
MVTLSQFQKKLNEFIDMNSEPMEPLNPELVIEVKLDQGTFMLTALPEIKLEDGKIKLCYE